ncbi:MAG: phosphatidylserine/phosphatidylglycerophosphate/cardiolipin synthase family protein [Actinomycetota bacterium]|nr:phosphatidylserine/phosphatidylglycerophosphate/cardiolipin synthase family protein [Actinomycetota bacterium]
MKDRRTGPRAASRRLAKLAGGSLLSLAAAEVALAGGLQTASSLRRRLKGEPKAGFPKREWPEIELESGDARLKLYSDYEGLYEAMLEEIEGARERIFLETFIFKHEEVGRRFAGALAKKAQEGVEVHIVYDALASLSTSPELFPEGVHVLPYGPISGPISLLTPYNCVRDHRKILTVDGRVAFLGGFNFGVEYSAGWRDTHVRVAGDAVRDVEDAFAGLWNRRRTGPVPEISLPRRRRAWNPATTLRVNDPTMGLFPIRSMYLAPLDRAKERIYLTSVYFVPSKAIKERLKDAARRNVDVQILVPWQTSYAVADRLARRQFGELLEAGVRIFEYDGRYIHHAKTATVNGVWSTVGSANLDSLSLFGLHEVNLEVYSERFAEQMEGVFEMDKSVSEEVTLEKWRSRPLHARLIEGALAPVRPFG